MFRIVGTHNTANEVFHCVHFEAPAMADLQGVRVSPGPPCVRSEGSRSAASIDDVVGEFFSFYEASIR